MTAKMIPVVDIDDTSLVSSTIPEDDHPAWASGTTYAANAKVIKGHKVWESVQDSNNGHDPEELGSEWWVDLGATNRWSAFDGYIQNQAAQSDSANWVIVPHQVISSVSLFNVSADTVFVVVTDPIEGEVYNEEFALVDNTGVIDAWTYFFSPVVTLDTLSIANIPPYQLAEVSITIERQGDTAAVGQIAIGYSETIGTTLNEVPLGIDDYTRLNEDQFGRTSPAIRGYARTAMPAIIVDTFRVPYMERLLADQRGIPTVWTFDTQFGENTLAYLGFYRNFSFLYQYAEKTILDIEIRSLV